MLFSFPTTEERISTPADTVISYWKPEVAVRIVNDFTHYPMTHGTVYMPCHFSVY
jgi:hypothetical protein